MPLTAKGRKILDNFIAEYGEKNGTSYFYAAKNKGTITGVDSDDELDAVLERLGEGFGRLVAECDAVLPRVGRHLDRMVARHRADEGSPDHPRAPGGTWRQMSEEERAKVYGSEP